MKKRGKNLKFNFKKIRMHFEGIWWLMSFQSITWLIFFQSLNSFSSLRWHVIFDRFSNFVAEKPTISNIADHRVCLPCASQIFLMKKLEITSNLSRVVGIGVEVVFVKKNQNFQIQISRNWAYHFFGGFWGPSIYRSWGSILIGLYPSDPRCWRSMHTYIGCFHPKHKFDISHKNWNHKISSCPVYFYCPRYNLNLRK